MKRRNSVITLVVLVAILVLGVGYAVVSNVTLTVSGNASTVTTDLKVSFEGTVAKDTTHATRNGLADKPATVTATATKGELTAVLQVENLEKKDDYVTATYTIQNEETDVAATITQGTISNNKSTFFEVTTDATTAKSLAAGGTTTVTITVKLIKTPVTAEDSVATITVPFIAEPANN